MSRKLTQSLYSRPEQQVFNDVSKIQDLMQRLKISSAVDPQSHLSKIEAALLQLGHDLAIQDQLTHGANSTSTVTTGYHPTANAICVSQWTKWLIAMMQENQGPHQEKRGFSAASTLIDGVHVTSFDTDPALIVVAHDKDSHQTGEESDNDLEVDLAKAALDTGTKAFEAQEWKDANSLLMEGLRLLQQLSARQRTFCDLFSLHYKLAKCAYHTRHPVEAEEALQSLIEQSAETEKQRVYILEARHFLAQVYIKLGQVENARSSCEKSLQGRRRLLGKQSKAAMESLALMAHIYVLQDNRALAKSCLSMIHEDNRDAILAGVEASIGPTVEHLDFASLLRPPGPAQGYGATPTIPVKSPARGHERPMSGLSTDELLPPDMRFLTIRSSSSAASVTSATSTDTRIPLQAFLHETSAYNPSALATPSFRTHDSSKFNSVSRKAILDKIGCQPRDRIEEAVCASDLTSLISLLAKKKPFWRSGPRKRGRSERVTALHFAALFGETDMAQRLLDAGYNINDIPFGYSTPLSPLHFAIGARQPGMVQFLVDRGAKSQEPDTWATLAGQLLSRAWLVKTMAGEDRDAVPVKILEIMQILLKAGWNLNKAIDKSGKTVLHQAVGFWTGAYKWDLELRRTVTEFLCEQGADPKKADGEGRTPFDLALVSEHQDLIALLSVHMASKQRRQNEVELVELPVYAYDRG